MFRRPLSGILAALLLLIGGAVPPVYGAAATAASGQIGGKAAQLVYVNPSEATMQVTLAGGSVVSDLSAKTMVSGMAAGGQKVAAAINGAYFNAYYKGSAGISYPNNCPRVYGTILQGGKLINGGGTNQAATLGFTDSGKALIDWVSLSPRITFSGGIQSIHWPTGQRSFEVTPWGLNNYYADPGAVMQFTDEMTLPVTCPASSQVVQISGGKVTSVAPGSTFSVPKNSDVVVFNQTAAANAKQWDQFPAVGDSVSFAVKRTPASLADQDQWDQVVCAIGVGPMILQDGVSVTGKDKVTEAKQAPTAVNQKSFAAVMKDGRLLLGTCVASYDQIAAYLSGIGGLDAMSLDGGASSALYTAAGGFVKPAGRNLSNMVAFLEKPVQAYVPFSKTGQSAADFSDVKGHWAEGSIQKVMEKDMYSGISKTAFGPDSQMTRGMFVTALGKYAESQGILSPAQAAAAAKAASRFQDVKASEWYGPYVGWAANNGLVSGTSDNAFSPNAPIEREQLCVILERFLELVKQSPAPGTVNKTAAFGDDGRISGWAKDAVYLMKGAAIVSGYEDGTFRPRDQVTRGEAAVMLTKALKL